MAPHRRKQISSLSEKLFKEGHTFEFHQAIRIAESIHSTVQTIGQGSDPEHESIILKSRILFSYPSSDIYKISYEPSKIIIQVNFFGLAGANGPLPLPYTEKIFEGLKARNRSTADFLDVFNHRLLSILHRIRTKYWIGLESISCEKTGMGQIICAFLGVKESQEKNQLSFSNRNLFFYTGLFWQQPKSSIGLKILLQHFFDIPVSVKPFQGGWESIEISQLTKIGFKGQHHILGQSAALGTKVWNSTYKICLQFGPLSYEIYQKFQPDQVYFKYLKDLVSFYLGRDQKFDLNFIIKTSSLEKMVLGKKIRLGWNTWLNPSHQFSLQDDQVTLQVNF